MIKKCSNCKEDKHIDLFNFRNTKKGLKLSYCADCGKLKTRKHYLSNKEYYKSKARANNRKYITTTMTKIFDYLSKNPCVSCGESDPIVLEFDHIKGEKVAAISKLVTNGGNWDRIEAEIAKCQVLCANCHRRKTAKQFGYYSYLNEYAPIV